MKQPQRLLDGRLTPDERRALEAGLSLRAPASSKARIWAGVSVGVAANASAAGAVAAGPVAAAQVSASGSGALTTTSQLAAPTAKAMTGSAALAGVGAAAGNVAAPGLTIAKMLVTWALVGTGVGVGAKLALEQAPFISAPSAPLHQFRGLPAPASTSAASDRLAPVARRSQSSSTQDDSNQPVETPPDTAQGPPAPKPRASSTAAAQPVAATSDVSSLPRGSAPSPVSNVGQSLALEQESRRVEQARRLLRAGQPRECIAVLAEVDAQFPQGWLQQERRALAIEARAALGQQDQVRDLAREFVNDYPESPYASKVNEMARP